MTSAASSLVATGRSRRRKRMNRVVEGLTVLATAIALGTLVAVVLSVLVEGYGALNVDFFTRPPVAFGQTGGGIAHAIVGTAVMVGLAALMSVPVGILTAVYTIEFAPRPVAPLVRLLLDVLAGIPTIVIGIFVFALLVVNRGQSGFAGACGLAIVMLPLVARSAEEVLLQVPGALREAGLAIGATRSRTLLRIVLPSAMGGMVTGAILAVARAAGETAPLLFASSITANLVSTDVRTALPSIPLTIYTYSESPSAQDKEQAWAAALVLLAFVLLASTLARVASRRRRGLSGQR